MPAFFPIIRNKLILLAYIREGGGGGELLPQETYEGYVPPNRAVILESI